MSGSLAKAREMCSEGMVPPIDLLSALPVHPRLDHEYCPEWLQGYGTLLMEEAERIARREHRSLRLAVISGVGTRHYYRKLGYHLEGHYMLKELK